MSANVIQLSVVGLSLASVFASIGIVSWWLLKSLHPTTPKPLTTRQKQIAPLAIAISLGVFFFYAPAALDSAVNTVNIIGRLPMVTKDTQELFASLWIADTYAETLLWPTRDMNQYNGLGHVDIPRLIEGNVALQGFAVTTRVWLFGSDQANEAPKGVTDAVTLKAAAEMWGVWPLFSLPERAMYQIRQLSDLEKNSNGTFRVIKTKQDLIDYEEARKNNKHMTAGYLSIKGLHAIGKELSNIDKFVNEGVHIMSLVTMFDNDIGGSSQGQSKSGLKPFGRKVVDRLVKNKVIIDVSQASEALLDDLYQQFNGSYPVPLISSSTGINKICHHPRNLQDKHIKMIANSGGFVSISFFAPTICSDNHVASIAQSIKYIVKLVGSQHVSLGSGFDSMNSLPFDATGMQFIVQGLIDQGLAKSDIALIMGQNVKNLLEKHLP